MPEARKIQVSFTGGELSPNLYARVDLNEYKAGAATMRNFYADVRGGTSTRPGTLFCGYSGTQIQPGDVVRGLGAEPFATGPILRPFIIGQGTDDSYIMEFGQFDLTSNNGYIRFWQNALPVLDPTVALTITGATNANPAVISATNTFAGGEWVFLSGVLGMTQLNGWWQVLSPTGGTFEIAALPFLSNSAEDSSGWGAYTSGGTGVSILTLTTPFLLGDILQLKWAQSADVLVLTHPAYTPQLVEFNAGESGTFAISTLDIDPTQQPPTDLLVTDGGTTDPDYCWSYAVTSTSLDGKSESVMVGPYFRHYTIPDDTTGWAEQLSWVESPSPTLFYTIYKCGPFDDRAATGPGTIWGKIGNAQAPVFSDNNIPPDFNAQPPIFGDPFSGGQIEAIQVTAAGSGWPSGSGWTGYIVLSFSGDGTGASGYAVTDYTGKVTGAFITNPGKNYSTCTVTAAGPGSGATFTVQLSSTTPTYPACAAFYQQRLLLGGSNSKPFTLALSVPGDYFSFNTTPISQPNDAFPVDIAGTEVDTIQSFMPVSYGCLIFTTGGVYLCNGGGQSQDISPSSIAFVPQAADGANWLQPIRINYSVLYNQFRGCVIRELAFAWQRQSYIGNDISALSNHLFFGHTILNWTWSEALWRQVLAVREDGIILCMTYQPELPDPPVRAWSHWDTQGDFISITSIPEGDHNINYSSVTRNVQPLDTGEQWTTYIERFDARDWDCALDSWCLDCATSNVGESVDFTLIPSGPSGEITFTLEAL